MLQLVTMGRIIELPVVDENENNYYFDINDIKRLKEEMFITVPLEFPKDKINTIMRDRQKDYIISDDISKHFIKYKLHEEDRIKYFKKMIVHVSNDIKNAEKEINEKYNK